MKPKIRTKEKQIKVRKIFIPDDEIMAWIEIYHSIGLSFEEIDELMGQFNFRYAVRKNPLLIEKEVNAIASRAKFLRGSLYSPEEIEEIRQKLKEKYLG